MPSVFISYNWQDKAFAMRLARELRKNSIGVWIDEDGLKIGDSLPQEIPRAIENNDFVVAIISHNSINSKWVQKELALAMDKEIDSEKVVLPVLIEPLEKDKIPALIRDKLWADFTRPENFDDSFSKLLNSINVLNSNNSPHLKKQDKQKVKTNDEFFNTPPLEILYEGDMRFFDDEKSSIKVVHIDPERKEVEAEVNNSGQIKNEVLIINKTRIFYTEAQKYSFILKEVIKVESEYVAKFICSCDRNEQQEPQDSLSNMLVSKKCDGEIDLLPAPSWGRPIAGSSGKITYYNVSEGVFKGAIILKGLASSHRYILSINGKPKQSGNTKLPEIGPDGEERFFDFMDITTNNQGDVEKEFEKPLESSKYFVKFFVKDPSDAWRIVLYNEFLYFIVL